MVRFIKLTAPLGLCVLIALGGGVIAQRAATSPQALAITKSSAMTLENANQARLYSVAGMRLDRSRVRNLYEQGDVAGVWELLVATCHVQRGGLSSDKVDVECAADVPIIDSILGRDSNPTYVEIGNAAQVNWLWFAWAEGNRNDDVLLLFFNDNGDLISSADLVVSAGSVLEAKISPASDVTYLSWNSRVWGTGVSYSQWSVLRGPRLIERRWESERLVFSGLHAGYSEDWLFGGLYDITMRKTATKYDPDEPRQFAFKYTTSFIGSRLVISRTGCFDCKDPSEKTPSWVRELFIVEPDDAWAKPAF